MSEIKETNWKTSSDLEWIQSREIKEIKEFQPFNRSVELESGTDRLVRKIKENPVVPIGTVVTIAAFIHGVRSFYIGDSHMSQKMMRLRVGAQAVTLVSVAVAFMLATPKLK